jgi:hypothetical protein
MGFFKELTEQQQVQLIASLMLGAIGIILVLIFA